MEVKKKNYLLNKVVQDVPDIIRILSVALDSKIIRIS